MTIDWKNYDPGEFYDELISTPGYARAPARNLTAWLRSLSYEELQARKVDAELAIIDKGVTFTVYSDGENIDRAWPFDIIPRVMPVREWRVIEAGLKQRLQALNLFIDDLYHEQKIIRDGIVPGELITGKANYRREMHGIEPLPLAEDRCLLTAKLPHLHRDPFDRMLVCQAMAEAMAVLTPDPDIARYPVRTIW